MIEQPHGLAAIPPSSALGGGSEQRSQRPLLGRDQCLAPGRDELRARSGLVAAGGQGPGDPDSRLPDRAWPRAPNDAATEQRMADRQPLLAEQFDRPQLGQRLLAGLLGQPGGSQHQVRILDPAEQRQGQGQAPRGCRAVRQSLGGQLAHRFGSGLGDALGRRVGAQPLPAQLAQQLAQQEGVAT